MAQGMQHCHAANAGARQVMERDPSPQTGDDADRWHVKLALSTEQVQLQTQGRTLA